MLILVNFIDSRLACRYTVLPVAVCVLVWWLRGVAEGIAQASHALQSKPFCTETCQRKSVFRTETRPEPFSRNHSPLYTPPHPPPKPPLHSRARRLQRLG